MIEDDIKSALGSIKMAVSDPMGLLDLLTRAQKELASLRENLETEQNHVLDRAMKIKAVEAERDAAVAALEIAAPVARLAVLPSGQVDIGWIGFYKPKHNDLLFAAPPKDTQMLIHCRSSVAADLRMQGQFLDRKGAAVNGCDTDEYARVEKLLAYIDAAIAKGEAP